MQCDWEVEIGTGAAEIEAAWPGYADLRSTPELSCELPEAKDFAALAEALARLNAAASPVWTSKCDVWEIASLGEVRFDRFDLDASAADAAAAVGCYIDLLPRSDQQWHLPERAEGEARALCARLAAVDARCCRADLVVRRARFAPERNDFGITAYLTACGQDGPAARQSLAAALGDLADAVLSVGDPAPADRGERNS